MNLDDAKQTFIAESQELLREMEADLLRLESEAQDKDLLNAIFRAAHTIKGSAGLFGLDYIVGFTHLVENVLDKLRDGEIAYNADLAALLLGCRDHINDLIEVAEQGAERPAAETLDRDRKLVERLRAVLGINAPEKGDAPAAHAPAVAEQAQPVGDGGRLAQTDAWHLSLRFGQAVMRNGMDPLSFIRYLGTLGRIVHVAPLPERIPPLADMDPESCYLGFEIQFKSEADKETIARVFEFVREDSVIRILPPHSRLSDYVDLIKSFPEEEARLGTLLVACGAVTRAELDEALQIQACPARLDSQGREHKPLGEILVEQGAVRQEVVDTALIKQKQVRDKKSTENQYIRIQAGKLDELIDLVGELVIAGASNALLARRAGQPVLRESASAVSRLVERIRNRALELRMVQIGETFNRFQRVVRDVSKELGKEIELVVSGADTELDKSVVEKIGDPLMHLVRNAMDHGIEPVEGRLAGGKPARATVRMNARHESGVILIEVSDDGGGLDRERILRKAVERGLAGAGQELTDAQVFGLIFEPGFSTAEQVTNLSGRGVGMDVVRRNIEALHGSVDIESTPGAGTTIRIGLPLTLAIIDGFLVKVGKAGYVIPLEMVMDCLEMTEAHREATRERNIIDLRGEPLPFLRLREQFDLRGGPARREHIVVVQHGSLRVGFVVDELLGKLQAVIKPLGNIFRKVRGISGSTILASGDVALILDVQALADDATRRSRAKVESTEALAG